MKNVRFLFCVWLILATSLHAQTYEIIGLGTLGGSYSSASAINASGVVVGYGDIAGDASHHATRFSGTGSNNTDLGTLGGTESEALGINDSGTIVGSAWTTGDKERYATRFGGSGGGNVALNTTAKTASDAYAIGNGGSIVGITLFGGTVSDQRATLFSSGNTYLPHLGGPNGVALAVNSGGSIVGWSDQGSYIHATRFNDTKDLGTLGGDNSLAGGINDSGTAVGAADTAAGEKHAVIFSGSGSGNTDLGNLDGEGNSSAADINNSGVIVGMSKTGGLFGQNHAFIYRNGKMEDLNKLIPFGTDATIYAAVSINDAGQIAANGSWKGKYQALLLNPVVTFKITATASPSAKGVVKGAGTFKKDKTITLTATAKKGATFVKWTENGKTVSTKKAYSFKVTKARTLVAHFK